MKNSILIKDMIISMPLKVQGYSPAEEDEWLGESTSSRFIGFEVQDNSIEPSRKSYNQVELMSVSMKK